MGHGRNPTIFLLVKDASIADGLVRACRSQGFAPIVRGSVPELGSQLSGAARAPILLHTAALPPDQSISEVLDYFAWMAEHRMPTLVLASEDDLQLRLAARRAGCIGFHLLPLSDSELGELLAPLLAGHKGLQGRVLVVDDVKVEAMIAGQVLRKAGFEVQELCNELEIMDSIRSFQPDLILMDLNMPNATGSELTAIIRDHADMLLMPIVFLSGEQDATAQREAMRLGADEFLSKPVEPQTLVATVRARIKRSSGIRRRFMPLDETDEASGLMSRRGFVRQLEARLAGQAGEQQPAAPADGLLFLCIDDLEQLLKDADSSAERLLLGHLGTSIRAVLGSQDLAARFGQHSFTVFVPGADTDALLGLAHRLQRQLHDQAAQVGSTRPRISLSIGVAQLAKGEDALTLIARCEGSCLQARADGPGRVCVFGSKTSTDAAKLSAPPGGKRAQQTLASEHLELHYEPLMALSDRVQPARRYLVSAWSRSDGQAGAGQAMPDAQRDDAAAARDTELGHQLDYWCMEKTLDQLAADRNEEQSATAPIPLQLFVPQSIATVLRREWVLWMRDRLLERQLLAYTPIVVLRANDLSAHLGVANALFRLLGQLRVRVCLDRLTAQPAISSMPSEFPIAYAIADPPLVRAAEPALDLAMLIKIAHQAGVDLIAGGVDDEETLARLRQSGVDLAYGHWVQMPSTSMDFAF